MKLSQKVFIPCILLSVFLSLSSCDLFGFGKESLLEPEAFAPFTIESDFFALDSLSFNNIYVIDVIIGDIFPKNIGLEFPLFW